MKNLVAGIILCLCGLTSAAQNLTGKWYGKITQVPGGFSELYDFDLYLRYSKNIIGESHAYIPDLVKVRITLSGKQSGDSIILSESRFGLQEELVPIDWVSCFKNLRLKYHKIGSAEFLQGRWSGKSIEDKTPCLPGLIILSRSKKQLQDFFENGGFSVPIERQFASNLPPPPDFTSDFLKTAVRKVIEVPIKQRHVELRINDYLDEDNDTISIYLNRNLIVNKNRISKKPLKFNINIDPLLPSNEILLFADNLGTIPPNTSQLVIIDGKQTHRIIIESDKQKTAAVYLKYSP